MKLFFDNSPTNLKMAITCCDGKIEGVGINIQEVLKHILKHYQGEYKNTLRIYSRVLIDENGVKKLYNWTSCNINDYNKLYRVFTEGSTVIEARI